MIVCAGKIESFWFATPIGIGMVQSSINLTRIFAKERPKSVVFVGSAGSYGDLEIGEIIKSSSTCNIESGFLDKKCYSPTQNKVETDANVPRGTLHTVNSSNYITCNKEAASGFLDIGLAAENMEFFAVASVAAAFDVPFFGVFGVTNYCYEDAHKEFKTNHKMVMKNLNDYMNENHKSYM